MIGGMYDACVIALHARRVLHEGASAETLLDVLQFTERIDFVDGRGRVLANDVPEWLARLKHHHVDDARAGYISPPKKDVPARKLAGFVGGGMHWCVVTLSGGRQVESWFSRLELGDKDAAERRIWRSHFVDEQGITISSEPPQPLKPSLNALRNALTEIEAFARSNGALSWAEHFAKALAILDGSEAPLNEGLKHSNPAAQRVLQAASAAWCFGGMMSWNDGVVGDEATYDRVSETLYRAINIATVAAVAA